MTRPDDWASALEGVDLAVNASGALQTGLRDNVGLVQEKAVVALFAAAKDADVAHMIQISAAGAETNARNDFMASKARADEALKREGVRHTVLRPGLVIGRNCFGGTELLRALAGFPLLQPRLSGVGSIRSIALTDLVHAVRRIVATPSDFIGTFDLVGPHNRSLTEIIGEHRIWLGFQPARWHVPVSLSMLGPLRLLADALGWAGWRSPIRSNAIATLVDGVDGNVQQTRVLLGREPLALRETFAALGAAGKADRWHSRLALIYPLALAALILLWLASGALGLARTGEATAYLVPGGLEKGIARTTVIAASLADIVIGVGLLIRPLLAKALKASIVLAIAYCAGSLVVRPDIWVDPLTPMLKVVPIIVLSLACLALAEER